MWLWMQLLMQVGRHPDPHERFSLRCISIALPPEPTPYPADTLQAFTT